MCKNRNCTDFFSIILRITTLFSTHFTEVSHISPPYFHRQEAPQNNPESTAASSARKGQKSARRLEFSTSTAEISKRLAENQGKHAGISAVCTKFASQSSDMARPSKETSLSSCPAPPCADLALPKYSKETQPYEHNTTGTSFPATPCQRNRKTLAQHRGGATQRAVCPCGTCRTNPLGTGIRL